VDDQNRELFRRQLIALDPVTPTLRARYECALSDLLERKISLSLRLAGGMAACVSLALGIGLLARVAGYGEPLPIGPELGVASGLSALGLAGWMSLIVARGAIRPVRDEPWAAVIGIGGVAGLGATVLWVTWQTNDPLAMVQGTTVGLIFLAGAGIMAVLAVMRHQHLQTKIKLLEPIEEKSCHEFGRPSPF